MRQTNKQIIKAKIRARVPKEPAKNGEQDPTKERKELTNLEKRMDRSPERLKLEEAVEMAAARESWFFRAVLISTLGLHRITRE